ncbi:MAG: hypothetical protein QFX35_07460, partial [Candidatus Verstraetearchaeota archaeon]|nr:hypothetical protein [Candidatus Verstraetearchaeota archaeon]
TSCPADEAESLLACLIGSKHMEEIRKVSIGDRISSLLGSKKAVLEQRLRKLGKEIGPISKRDLEQAQIIFKGLGEYFDRKKGDLTI